MLKDLFQEMEVLNDSAGRIKRPAATTLGYPYPLGQPIIAVLTGWSTANRGKRYVYRKII